MRAIIPAAGWGRRLGSPPAKELLPHPFYPSRTFLEVVLEMCQLFQLDPLVISREDKVVLNNWLQKHVEKANFQIIPPTQEWLETVWLSRIHWKAKNILLLPDVFFRPHSIIEDLQRSLDHYEMVVATHLVPIEQATQWGLLMDGGFLVEKPQQLPGVAKVLTQDRLMAWGLLAFRNTEPVQAFWEQYVKGYRESRMVALPTPWQQLNLEEFVDLTRGSISFA
ncbi:MAG: hypothetical protein RMK80_05165 [Pseudobdellovibrionaceae bacterium]|nr:hypothetical protein [Pseudobdellovibrionaceae bacterium]